MASPARWLNTSDALAAGKALRAKVPRASHGSWSPPANRADPIAVIQHSNDGRVPELIPIRYGRMLASPFAFLRGAAALMAADLANTPATGIKVQVCGDCHLLNFGLFASPERDLVFDVNDFDETLPAPWEWDLKRLATSVVLCGRHVQARSKACQKMAVRAISAYQKHIHELAEMTFLDAWYERLDLNQLVDMARSARSRASARKEGREGRSNTAAHALPKLTKVVKGKRRIIDDPPLVYHVPNDEFLGRVSIAVEEYRATLRDDIRALFDRYRFVDAAVKIVGVGSVGTRCAIALFMASDDDALFLQFKEAMISALEPYAGKSKYANHGERVVTGQRLMQAASDIFLGWFAAGDGRDYYVRQLRDMKASAEVDRMTPPQLADYAEVCGWALARAHARSGKAPLIAGYIGNNQTFCHAVLEFAAHYANQTERDYGKLKDAVKVGRIHVTQE